VCERHRPPFRSHTIQDLITFSLISSGGSYVYTIDSPLYKSTISHSTSWYTTRLGDGVAMKRTHLFRIERIGLMSSSANAFTAASHITVFLGRILGHHQRSKDFRKILGYRYRCSVVLLSYIIVARRPFGRHYKG
jgi:hypothetical protein